MLQSVRDIRSLMPTHKKGLVVRCGDMDSLDGLGPEDGATIK